MLLAPTAEAVHHFEQRILHDQISRERAEKAVRRKLGALDRVLGNHAHQCRIWDVNRAIGDQRERVRDVRIEQFSITAEVRRREHEHGGDRERDRHPA